MSRVLSASTKWNFGSTSVKTAQSKMIAQSMPRSLGESLWTISYLRPSGAELFDEHLDDFAVLDFAEAEHVGAFAVVHLADDVG